MLPASIKAASFKTAPFSRRMIAGVLALGLALPAAPALALDRHEQGILAGALGMLLFTEIAKSANNRAQAAPAQPVPVQPLPSPIAYAPRVSQTPAAYAFASYTASERRAIQRSLARAGYYTGPVDGAFGPGTYNATLAYARAIGSAAAPGSQAGAYGIYDSLLYSR